YKAANSSPSSLLSSPFRFSSLLLLFSSVPLPSSHLLFPLLFSSLLLISFLLSSSPYPPCPFFSSLPLSSPLLSSISSPLLPPPLLSSPLPLLLSPHTLRHLLS